MKKIVLKYIIIYVPVVVGLFLFSSRVVNLFSSLLLFLGGYVAIKNTLDYRIVRKNVNSIKVRSEEQSKIVEVNKVDKSGKVDIKSMKSENVPGLKRTRVYSRVRRKY